VSVLPPDNRADGRVRDRADGRVRGIDLFDVDHTIIRRSSGARFIAAAIHQRFFPKSLLLLLPWYSFTYRLGVLHIGNYENEFPLFRGLSRNDFEAIAEDSFRSRMLGDIHPEAAALIAGMKTSGRKVYLATSSLDIIVAPLARHLGVDGVIATSLEFRDGICTGRYAGPPLFRGGKMSRVLRFMEETGVDAAECSFYSDSVYDLPLLSAVGRPVAVNPDFRLRRLARRRGWEILKFS
jgi:putative phosphoserine phosphatase / 1-acylglycerol-3-phosphate O-acyltransferase